MPGLLLCPRCHRQYQGETACPYDGTALSDQPRLALIEAKPTEFAGKRVAGRYRLHGLVGQGGMAYVFLAEDLENGEPVALKVLRGAHARDRLSKQRFQREARAIGAISHPNIVRVLDVGEMGDGAPYMTMEYLHGESLGQYLDREGPMDLDLALPVLEQLADALRAAHRAQILHRDIKPDNIILVGAPGDPYGIKLVDFGLAKLREGALTADGTVVGTVQYMAPEQAVTDPCDVRTDIYGLGAVGFRMITGQLPFQGSTNEETLAKHLLVAPMKPSDLLPALDPRVDAFLLCMLKKNPKNRYATTDELLKDISILLDETGPVSAQRADIAPEVYTPRSPFAQTVSKVFHRTLGLPPPTDS